MLKSYLKGPWRAPVSVLACLLLAAAFFGTYDLFFKYHLVVYGADYGRYPAEMQGYLWALNLLWYLIAVCISLGVTGLAPARRIPVLTELGRRTLQIYILHRPIRDLMEYRGFYTVVDPHSKLQVIGVVLFSAVLAVLLGNRAFTAAFSKLRSLFDPLLEKLGGL